MKQKFYQILSKILGKQCPDSAQYSVCVQILLLFLSNSILQFSTHNPVGWSHTSSAVQIVASSLQLSGTTIGPQHSSFPPSVQHELTNWIQCWQIVRNKLHSKSVPNSHMKGGKNSHVRKNSKNAVKVSEDVLAEKKKHVCCTVKCRCQHARILLCLEKVPHWQNRGIWKFQKQQSTPLMTLRWRN